MTRLSLLFFVTAAFWAQAAISYPVGVPITIAPVVRITFSPSSLTFGVTNVGSSSSPQSITATNNGQAPFSLSSISVTGTNSGDFSQTNTCPNPIAVNASCTINVTFTPTGAGASSAAVTVYATAGGPSFSAPLSGTGGSAALAESFFGQHISTLSGTWPVTINALGKCQGTTWPWIESANGVYDWTNLDYCVSSAQSHSSDYFVAEDCTSNGAPAGCQGGPEPAGLGIPGWTTCANLATDYGNFITALVNRNINNYSHRIVAYELWNEPGSQGCTGAQLAAATNAARSVIRSLDPTAKILAPSFVGGASLQLSQAQAWLSGGASQDVDGITIHGYNSPPEGFLTDLTNTIAEYAGYPTLQAKPVWDTEGGSYYNLSLPVATEVGYIARWYILHWAKGVVRTYWYAWDAAESIVGNSTTVTAYQQVEAWLIGSSNPVLAINGNVYTVTFTYNGASAQAVWNAADVNSSYTVPGGYGHYKDLTGATNAVVGGTVTIGLQPILLVP